MSRPVLRLLPPPEEGPGAAGDGPDSDDPPYLGRRVGVVLDDETEVVLALQAAAAGLTVTQMAAVVLRGAAMEALEAEPDLARQVEAAVRSRVAARKERRRAH